MLAAVLTELNKPLELADVSLTDLSYGQVRCRVRMSGICGAQLQEIRGEKGNAKFLPHLMGHEGSVEVLAVHPSVTKLKVGDCAVAHWRKGQGIESPFPEYIFRGKKIQSGKITTFSEESIISENRLTKISNSVPDQLAALLGCGLSTALATIEDEAKIRMGETLLIIGCGGLGLNLIRAAKMRSVCPIIVVDPVPEKRALALNAGASVFFPSVEEIFKIKPDVIIDTAGNVDAMQFALRILAPSGRYIMLGQPKPSATVDLWNASHLFEGSGKTIKATQGGGFMPDEDIPRYVKLFDAGLLDVRGIISDVVPLREVNRAISLVQSGKAGRVMLAT